MKTLLIFITIFSVSCLGLFAQENVKNEPKTTFEQFKESEELKRELLDQKIKTNSVLIEERRMDFEDTRASVNSFKNLVFWLFGLILSILLTYIGYDFFSTKGKLGNIEEEVSAHSLELKKMKKAFKKSNKDDSHEG